MYVLYNFFYRRLTWSWVSEWFNFIPIFLWGFSIYNFKTFLFSTNKADRHNITEMLFKVALNTINIKLIKPFFVFLHHTFKNEHWYVSSTLGTPMRPSDYFIKWLPLSSVFTPSYNEQMFFCVKFLSNWNLTHLTWSLWSICQEGE